MEKKLLTVEQASCQYGISKSFLYKLTFNRILPYYKPGGKLIFFDKNDLEEWMTSNRILSANEITEKAKAYCLKTKKN